MMVGTITLALSLAPAAGRTPTWDVTGFYGGGYGPAGAFTYTQLDLKQSGTALSGDMYQPYSRAEVPKLSGRRLPGGRVQVDSAGIEFDLRKTATGLAGRAIVPGNRAIPAYFAIRPLSPPPKLLTRYQGTYALPGGKLLTLSQNNGSTGFWYLELPSGRTGFLFNISDRQFIAGPCLYCAGPERLRVTFAKGARTELFQRVAVRLDGRDLIGTRLHSYREVHVSFASKDGTKLAGSLYVPAAGGRHPAVVLVHGSGAQTRNGFYGHIRYMAEAYARAGIAALAYDKRGTGESQGQYDTAGFATLADDAAAALRYLRARNDIDGDRLGLSGVSQAGWLSAMAATRFPRVKIVQIRSASAPMGVEESERSRLTRQMHADGFGEAEITKAMQIRTMMDAYAKSERGWDALAAAAEPVKNSFWMKRYIGGLPDKDSSDWPWLREAFAYDVRGDFAAYGGRWQILYGTHDALLDYRVMVPLVRRVLAHGQAREVDIEVIPNGTHDGFDGKTGGDKEFPGLSRFVPGFFDKIVGWAKQRL